MEATQKNNRDLAVDLIKTFAIVGVLLIHTAASAYSTNALGSPSWYFALFWGSVSRASVPLFLMCSGVLFLSPQRELPGKKLWGRYILRILAALFFWAALYKLYHLILGRNLSFGTLLSSCKELLAFQHESHLYYLHIVLLVYAFLPLLQLLTRYGSKRLVEYFLGLWFVLGILYPTVKGFWPFTLLSGVPTQWMMNMTYASLGYVLLGYYLRRWPIRRGLSLSLLAVGFAVVFGLTAGFSLRQGSLNTQFWEGMTIGVCAMAAGIFSLFCSVQKIPSALASAAGFFSKASFCVYLCHIVFLNTLQGLGLSPNWLTPLVGIPVLAALTMGCSLVVYLVASRIPVMRHWLI